MILSYSIINMYIICQKDKFKNCIIWYFWNNCIFRNLLHIFLYLSILNNLKAKYSQVLLGINIIKFKVKYDKAF